VLGLARAHAALGESDRARTRYRELLANFDEADADVPEVAEARAALAPPAVAQSEFRGPLGAVIALGAIALIAVAVVIRGRRRTKKKKARTKRAHS
jgi:hypothetical protein